MKKFIYTILGLIIGLFGLTFAFQNRHDVAVNYYFDLHWESPLVWVLFVTFVLGSIVGILISLSMVARMQRQLYLARKEVRQAEQEVTNLRALPIKDVL